MATKYIIEGALVNGDGTTSAVAATPGAAGAWTLTVLEPNSVVGGINSAGDLAAGTVNDQPAYWKRTGATWSAATLMPSGSCSGIAGVDDSGRILGNPCRPGGFRWVPVIWLPPYDAASIRTFGGLGDTFMGGHPKAISIHGTWVVGGAFVPGIFGFIGTYWRAF